MPVQAGELYKCSDANGQIAIQSEPCPKGTTQLWKRDASPEAAPTAGQMAAAVAKRERDANAARELSLLAGTTRPAPLPPAPPQPELPAAQAEQSPRGPCRRAHELAAEIRGLAVLELSSSQLYRLDQWVIAQCEQARNGD